MTEGEALHKLMDLLERVRHRSLELEHDMSWMSPESRSSLAGDDTKSAPYQLSHCVYHAMMTSLDHLHCLRSSLRKEGADKQVSATM